MCSYMIDNVLYDLLGNEIRVGSHVLCGYYSRETLVMAVVTKLAKKSMRLKRHGIKSGTEFRRPPEGVVVIDGPALTMYLLKKGMSK